MNFIEGQLYCIRDETVSVFYTAALLTGPERI